MKPTSTSGLHYHMSWWSDSPATKSTCKRNSHRADRKAARLEVLDMADEGGEEFDMITYIPADESHDYPGETNMGCPCRRCLIHDDPGGCLLN